MVSGCVILVNANRMRPPVAPLGLDYVGEHLKASGFEVRLVDLAFEDEAALAGAMGQGDPLAVGVSFRNTDDCYCFSGADFVPSLGELVVRIKSLTRAPVVLGGCGYSLFPAEILEAAGADLGIWGDGEAAMAALARRLAAREDVRETAGLVWRDDGGRAVVNAPSYRATLEVSGARGLVDNGRYLREGGMGNIETKRGCPGQCVYCADPVAKGRHVRCRPAASVADEIERLAARGIDVLHVCDGEFNIPPAHAEAVCEEMIRRGLGDRVRWYCYAAVHPFGGDLAALMRRAGCVGINFGADSGCDRMLAALGRGYRRGAIREAVRQCRRSGILVMLDLLIGGPGEDEASVRESIGFVQAVNPDCAGAATGIRVYPGTALAARVRSAGPMAGNPNLRGAVSGNESLLRPVFYLDAALGPAPAELVCGAIGGDGRFFPPPRPSDADSYNYNDNRELSEAIAAGGRGAFWDILRRLRGGGVDS